MKMKIHKQLGPEASSRAQSAVPGLKSKSLVDVYVNEGVTERLAV